MNLNGNVMPSTNLRPECLAMRGFSWRLKDDEVAVLATFVRKSWSNDAPAVRGADVAKLRGKTNEIQ